jgi:hypothetical protein
MARPPIKVPYQDRPTVALLTADMSFQEVGYKAVTAIQVENNITHGIHDRRTVVPTHSLEIVEDPNGNATGSPGSTLICRGKAIIGGASKAVAAFRKGSAPGPTGTPGPAQPASEGSSDTGPEGNPTLNADGTPRTGSPPPAAPSPPPAQPASDVPSDTGPEGNPNLNSDGTPRAGTPPPPPPPRADDEPSGGAEDV